MAEPILDMFALFGPVPPRGKEEGTKPLLAAMTQYGVVGAVALSTRSIYYSASAGNRETQAQCEASGQVLQPMGLIDPRQVGGATGAAGAKVLCILPTTQHWPLNLISLTTALKELVPAKLPLFVETGKLGEATLAAQVLESVGWTAPVILGGVNYESAAEAFAIIKERPSYYLATNGLIGIGEIATAVEQVGADKVVFASGAISHAPMGAMVRLIHAAHLSDMDRTKVLSANAKRLLAGGV
jgi:hypothetical protein